MQIAGVDIYVNHPVLHLGATDWVPLSLALDTAPAASCDTHVAVRVRPQRGLIKVRLFAPPGDRGQFNVRVAVNAPGPDASAIDIIITSPSK
ncbi:hypothetical protein ACFYVE_33050 [Streptomyces tendae]|uniref:hypothetical protein n=1 Tax=Streptomyces tendae TaxID=1932 RepID=UPI0036C9F830